MVVYVEVLSFILIGLVAGGFSGLLGIGGGLIIVPFLAFTFKSLGMPGISVMQMASGTSLAIMIITTASSAYFHYRRGGVVWSMVLLLLPGMILGVGLGALIAHYLSTKILEILFALFLFMIALRMFFMVKLKSKQNRLSDGLVRVIGVMVGLKSGLFGVGGGAITVPLMVRCHYQMKYASGTSTVCSFIMAIVGTIAFSLTGPHNLAAPIAYSSGYVYWPAFGWIAGSSVVATPIGTYFSHRLSSAFLKRLFAIFLFFIASNLLWHGML